MEERLRIDGDPNGRTIIYVGAKYDYEDKSRGLGYEHYQFYMALVKMGYKVIYFPYDQFKKEYGRKKMSLMLREAVYYWQPEILLYYHFADWVDLKVFQEISNDLPTKTIILLGDDGLRYEQTRPVWEFFNVVVTMDPNANEKRKKEGFKNAFLSQWGINHFLYKNLNLKRIYDVSFIGQCYGKRPFLIEELRKKGVNIVTFGHGWPGSGRILQSDMIKIYNQTKIVFNTYLSSKNTPRMNARDFEALSCSSLSVTEDIDEVKKFFVPGKEIITYKDLNDAAEKIKYYLSHEIKRQEIVKAGYKRVLKDHTYEKIFKKVFEFTQKIKK